MIHVDVTKFGNIPDGGGWRYVDKQQGDKNKATTALRTGRTTTGHPNIGTAFVHTVIDDHSRVAYAEIQRAEKKETAIFDNHHRAHSAIAGRSPISRLTNVPGHHS